MQPVPVEAAAEPDVFPSVVHDGQRLLPALQPVRRVGARLRRLLVRLGVPLRARLLSPVPVLRAPVGDRRPRTTVRRRREMRRRELTGRPARLHGVLV